MKMIQSSTFGCQEKIRKDKMLLYLYHIEEIYNVPAAQGSEKDI